ncbi:MAG: GntR family transcriptional regulator [Coriobacteriales bacterium]|jgi:GntR family transcriptional regulator|nr:GntR family transcriptional regulator [Coriobacteriales bacterium]
MDDFAIDEKSGIPVWVQLRNRLIFLITSGHYAVGDQLPTVHKMAIMLKINYNTVNKVYQGLERDGYIVSRRGQGTFVIEFEGAAGAASTTTELITDEYLARMKELGLTPRDVIKLVERRQGAVAKARPPEKGKGERG